MTEQKITAYKGFGQDMTCLGHVYEVGQTYTHDGEVQICAQGFHSCEMPLDVWSYYDPATSRFARVAVAGEMERGDDDSKIVSASITISSEMSISDLIACAVNWIVLRADSNLAQGYSSHAATLDSSHAAAQGDRGHAAAQGYRSHAAAQGDRGHAAVQDYSSHAATQGYRGAAAAQGDRGHATAQGGRGRATTQGDRGHAVVQGDRGHATTQGDGSHATTQGDGSRAAAQGNSSHATTQGDRGRAAVHGCDSIAASLGADATAQADDGGWIVLAVYGDWSENRRPLLMVRAAKVGGPEGVKPGVVYRLTQVGEFEEVAQ